MPTVGGSSTGTTTSTGTRASDSTPRPTSTTAEPRRSVTRRGQVLNAAYAAHPERFVRKAPTPPELPTVAWMNRPEEATTTAQ